MELMFSICDRLIRREWVCDFRCLLFRISFKHAILRVIFGTELIYKFWLAGTLNDPIIVKSGGNEQYAGCTGYPADSHSVVWLTVRIISIRVPFSIHALFHLGHTAVTYPIRILGIPRSTNRAMLRVWKRR